MEARIDLRDLAVIGDRRTAALIDRKGNILWYCPGRFDHPSLLAALLDANAGAWRVALPGAQYAGRGYRGASGVLDTHLASDGGQWRITDWLAMGEGVPRGLCRLFARAPCAVTLSLHARPDYGRRAGVLRATGRAVRVDDRQWLYASHPLSIHGDRVDLVLPAGETGWAALLDHPHDIGGQQDLEAWLHATQRRWEDLDRHTHYEGPYAEQVADSLRALRLLTYEDNGGVVAAATTSLPEVLGGPANWDYRYVWLRDAGMIVSALTRAAGSDGLEERKFLDFICSAKHAATALPLAPFARVDFGLAPQERRLPLRGYGDSRPVRVGNGARDQLQLDGYGNVLLAAKLIYSAFGVRDHWATVAGIADYLARNWRCADHGLWEEPTPRHYTASKVIAACGLSSIADFAESADQARRWRDAVADIRAFVSEHCLTPEGAFAYFAGSADVDIAAALFPVWNYTDADSAEMRATIALLDARYSSDGMLYRRHLADFDSSREGAFLAGSLWMAQYRVMRKELRRVEASLQRILACGNDVGLFAEECAPHSGVALGNLPQAFVHAAFLGLVHDLKIAQQGAAGR